MSRDDVVKKLRDALRALSRDHSDGLVIVSPQEYERMQNEAKGRKETETNS